MMIWCPECNEPRDVSGWKRDDPILNCGHIKRSTPVNDALNEAWIGFQLLKEYIKIKTDILIELGFTEDRAKILVAEEYAKDPLSEQELRNFIRGHLS